MRIAAALALAALAACSSTPPPAPPGTFILHTRQLDKQETVAWKASETAVIICDMWDSHTCKGAVARVVGLVPKLNAFVDAARAQGSFIVHSPSDTMKFYEGTPGRKLAQAAPAAAPPVEIKSRRLIVEKEGKLPIDDKDWCDCPVKCPVKEFEASRKWPWTRQIESIPVRPGDAVSESGQEIYNLFVQRGIKNVILTGVHTNMCVLGRSFGIRQMTMLKMNVALARDLTDCLYDPKKEPYVSHDRGTELVVEHIERHWCPSILSRDLTGR